jgi:hypothetical protein
MAQERFLDAYAEHGSITAACRVADLSRDTAHRWRNEDRNGFRRRYEDAQHTFREEKLEAAMFRRIFDPTGNRGSDILLMFALKAHWPDKYKDTAQPTDDSAKDVLRTLMGWQQRGNGAVKDGGVKGHVP